MHVAQLWQYPVKSMIGVQVGEVDLDDLGIVGDRTWAVRDLERGGIRGAKKIGGLMRLAARYAQAPAEGSTRERRPVVITLPDGTEVRSDDDDADEKISVAVGHRVRLEALQPADDLDHYRRGPGDSDDIIAELRAVFGRVEDEPLPDLGQFPPVIVEYESPPGTYYDAFPLLVMTTSALASMQAALAGSVVDVRRFRPSIVLEVDDYDEVGEGTPAGHPELGWAGRRARIGTAEIELLGGCPRCVMVTREISPEIPADTGVLRHVVRELHQNVGAYASVVVPGRVGVDDRLHWV